MSYRCFKARIFLILWNREKFANHCCNIYLFFPTCKALFSSVYRITHPSLASQTQSNFLTLRWSCARRTILQSPFCWLRNIEAILKCEYAGMSERTHTHTHTKHSDWHTHRILVLARRSVGLGLRLSLVAVCGFHESWEPDPPTTRIVLPLAYISLASGDFHFAHPSACPSGYKLNFRICLEIHLLNYFAQQTQYSTSHIFRGARQGIFLWANMKNELHLTAAGSG